MLSYTSWEIGLENCTTTCFSMLPPPRREIDKEVTLKHDVLECF